SATPSPPRRGPATPIRPAHHRSLSLANPAFAPRLAPTPRNSISHATGDDSAAHDVIEQVISSITKDYFEPPPDSPTLSPQAVQLQFERARSKSISHHQAMGKGPSPFRLDSSPCVFSAAPLASLSDMESIWDSPKPVSHSRSNSLLSANLQGSLPVSTADLGVGAPQHHPLGNYILDAHPPLGSPAGGSYLAHHPQQQPPPPFLSSRRFTVAPEANLGSPPSFGAPTYSSVPTTGSLGAQISGPNSFNGGPPHMLPHLLHRRHSVAVPLPSTQPAGFGHPGMMGGPSAEPPLPLGSGPGGLMDDLNRQLNMSSSLVQSNPVLRTATLPAQLPPQD
ncbi:hypothetical protein BJ085DRAFT_36221, partial [Dimargaris cristalligena]